MPKLISDAAVVAWIHFLVIRRELVIYLLIFTLFPLSFLFFAQNLSPEGVDVGSRLITGSLVFSLGLTIVNELSQTLVNERFNQHLKLIVTSPVHKASYAAGIIVSGLLRGLLTSAIILLFAPMFGIDIELSLWLAPLLVLCALSLTGLALVIGTWAPSAQMGNLLSNTIGILVVLFSPLYYPLSRLPDWMEWPARLSPYTHAATAIDGVLSGAGVLYAEMGLLAAITATALAAGIWGMRWRES
ncbi:MAG TPA: ABC transporter permease [Dehalococcoidia bacterium]|nr:ABC transporter permease [Dehalococcoidia bacterium]